MNSQVSQETMKRFICDNLDRLNRKDYVQVFRTIKTRGSSSAFKEHGSGEFSVDLDLLSNNLITDIYHIIHNCIVRCHQ